MWVRKVFDGNDGGAETFQKAIGDQTIRFPDLLE
jgi:hypothetical protein